MSLKAAGPIVMLVANEFVHDTRVFKQARSLVEWGCEVHVVAMAGPKLPRTERNAGIIIHRLGWRGGQIWRLAAALMFWWCRPMLRRILAPLPGAIADTQHQRPVTGPSTAPAAPIKAGSYPRISPQSPVWRTRMKQRLQEYPAGPLAVTVGRWVIRVMAMARTQPRRMARRVWPRSFTVLALNGQMTRFAHALKPAILEAHDLNTLLAGTLVKRLTGCRLIYDSHELFLERNIARQSRWRDKLVWAPIERFCIRRCDAVMSVAQSICDHLARQYRIPQPHLIRNVQPYEAPAPRSRLLSQELRIPDGLAVVLYPGAITINRGLEVMIDSSVHLENAVYVVMGYARNPSYLAQLKQRAADLGVLGVRVFFRDAVPVDQVVQYTASADLGIVPTQNVCLSYCFEASNKIFHCLMAGVPLAMSDHPEKRLIVEQFGVGVLFDETDPRKIAAAVNQALSDRPRYERMKRQCVAAAREVNWEHEQQKLRSIFDGLLPAQWPPPQDSPVQSQSSTLKPQACV